MRHGALFPRRVALLGAVWESRSLPAVNRARSQKSDRAFFVRRQRCAVTHSSHAAWGTVSSARGVAPRGVGEQVAVGRNAGPVAKAIGHLFVRRPHSFPRYTCMRRTTDAL